MLKRTRQKIFYAVVGFLGAGVLLLPGFERPIPDPAATAAPADRIAAIAPQAQTPAAPAPVSPGGFAVAADVVAVVAALSSPPPTAIALGAPRQTAAAGGLRIGDQAVNLRTGPSTSYDAVKVATAGTGLTVIGRQGNWVQVQLADGASGWVYGTYIAGDDAGTVVAAAPEATPPPPPPQTTATAATTTPGRDLPTGRLASAVVVRASPDEGAPRVVRLNRGDRVTVAESRNGWLRVITADGQTGWVYSPGSL